MFEESSADVLLLLDCCAAAASASSTPGQSMTETIVACGWNSIAPGPGRLSFTHTLIQVLEDWVNQPFTVSRLHGEILDRLKHVRPERRNSRLVNRATPIYIVTTTDITRRSILLSKQNSASNSGSSSSNVVARPDSVSTPISERNLTSTSTNGALRYPHVLLSIALEEDQILDSGACQRWLAQCPLLAEYVTVESVFRSYSTLLLVSVPVVIWNLLPEDPACSFIGYVSSTDLTKTRSTDSYADAKHEITGITSFAHRAKDMEPDRSHPPTDLPPPPCLNCKYDKVKVSFPTLTTPSKLNPDCCEIFLKRRHANQSV